jgi:hypothetical protein
MQSSHQSPKPPEPPPRRQLIEQGVPRGGRRHARRAIPARVGAGSARATRDARRRRGARARYGAWPRRAEAWLFELGIDGRREIAATKLDVGSLPNSVRCQLAGYRAMQLLALARRP